MSYELLKQIIDNPIPYAHALGYTKLTEELHGPWIRDILFMNKNSTLQAHRGSYKCQSPDTMIMMSDCSNKRLGDISIGEYVMGWDGTPRRVIGRHDGISDMYRVTLNKNGEYYDCNNNHILTMRQRAHKHNKFHCVDKYRYDKDPMIINIPIEDYLKSPANKTNGKNSNETFFKHFKVGLENLPERTVDIPPYVLGAWLGDGSSTGVAITCADNENVVIDEFRKWCNNYKVKEHVYRKPLAKCATYVFNGGGIIKLFRKYNLIKNKHIPVEYLVNSKENRLELLAGLIDTDGHFGRGHFTYTTIRPELAKNVEWLARSLGYHATAKEVKTWCTYKGVRRDSKAWQVYINGNICEVPTRIERKKAKPKKQKVCHLSFSQKIKKIGKGNFVGIEIEGDGMFLMDNFLVVHNTSSLIVAFNIWAISKPLENLIFLRKTHDDVKEVIKAVSKSLKSDVSMNLMKDIYGKFPKFSVDSTTELELDIFKGAMGVQLLGLGLKSSITGKHGPVVTDDIVTLKDRLSGAERETTKSQYMELVNIASEENHFIVNRGTPWHKDDAFSLMPKPERFSVFETGILSPEAIAERKAGMSPSLFAANYELKHIADGDQLFIEPQYGPFPIGAKAYAQIDAAYGGEDASALTIIAERDGKLHTVGWKMQGHVENHYPEIISRLQRFQAVECWLENNADKGFLQKELSQRHNISFRGYHEAMNKYYKISTYGRKEWNRAIIDLDESDLEYVSEIMDYNENAEHDDCPDSFASLVRAKFQNKKEISFHRR